MASIRDLEPLITEPREDLSVEHKSWLDLTAEEHKANLAKAAIALANHGGGFIVMGMAEKRSTLISKPRPPEVPEVTQDAVNAAIRRYATAQFHCEVHAVTHPTSRVVHPIILVPGDVSVPVMSKRDCQGVIAQARCYIRKPGPESEEAKSPEEWRSLLARCVRANRDDMLEAIRGIVSGRITPHDVPPSALESLRTFSSGSLERWRALTANESSSAPQCFPHGFYEMGFLLVDATPASGLSELQRRLDEARRIKLTGWTPFLDMTTPGWSPYPHENFVEAWIGRTVPDRSAHTAAHSDFWRASPDGKLFTIRGYKEDDLQDWPPSRVFDVTLPVWRVGEAILFAARLAETFEGVQGIAVRCRYTGLSGRALVSVSGSRDLFDGGVSRSDEIVLETQATLDQIRDNLAEVLHHLLVPLYERFAFFRLPISLVEEELAKMLRGRF